MLSKFIYVRWLGREMSQQRCLCLVGREYLARLYLLGHHRQVQFLQDIFRAKHHLGPISDERVGPGIAAHQDRAWHGENVPSLLSGVVSGDQRPAPYSPLGNEHTQAKPADDAVARWEVASLRRRTQWVVAHQRPLRDNFPGQLAVLWWIDPVNAAA